MVILLLATTFDLIGPPSGQYLQNKFKNAGAHGTKKVNFL